MIRSEFGLDPWGLHDDAFVELWCEAAWLQQHKMEMLAAVLGLKKKKR